MQARAFAISGLLLACVALVPPVGPAQAEPVGNATLEVSSPAAVPWGTVTVTGTCPGETVSSEPADPDTPAVATEYPESTVLRLDGTKFATEVPLTEGRFSGLIEMQVPLDTAPGEYDLVTECGGSVFFTVLDGFSLSIAPDRVEPGRSVVVTGSCWLFGVIVPATPGIDLAGDGRWILGPLLLDRSTGVIAASTVTVPADVPPGKYTGTSNCDTTAALEVLPPGTESTPPTLTSGSQEEELVVVPTLLGLTRERAEEALGGQLRLGDVVGTTGPVVRQDPLPGERVARGSEVTVELAGAPGDAGGGEDESSFPLGIAAAAVAVVLIAAGAAWYARRPAREERWVRRTAYRARSRAWRVPDPPEEAVPTVGVRFQTELDPDPLLLEEVPGAPT